MVGSFVDARTNQTRGFEGTVGNDGGFLGQRAELDGTLWPVRGVFAGSGASGGGTPGGDFRLTHDGVEHQGNFTVVSGGPSTLPTFESAFQGAYNGAWSLPGLNQSGISSFSIDQGGNITGLFTRGSETGLFSGSVGNGGGFSGSVAYPSATYPLAGTLQKTADNSIVGNFRQSVDDRDYPGTFGPLPPLPASSPFVGAYRGRFSIPGLNQSGVVSFTVDQQGNLTGSLANGNETALFSAVVTNSGSFSGTAAYPASATYVIAGTLAATNNGTPAGDFRLSGANGREFAGSFGPPATAPPGVPNNPFAGTYRGAYALPAAGESGSVSFTIDTQGGLTGLFVNGPLVGVFTTIVDASGTFGGGIVFPAGVRPVTGKLAATGAGSGGAAPASIAGDFVQTVGGVNQAGTFDLTAGGSLPGNAFQGSYSGT